MLGALLTDSEEKRTRVDQAGRGGGTTQAVSVKCETSSEKTGPTFSSWNRVKGPRSSLALIAPPAW